MAAPIEMSWRPSHYHFSGIHLLNAGRQAGEGPQLQEHHQRLLTLLDQGYKAFYS
jgi:hypothetical protein